MELTEIQTKYFDYLKTKNIGNQKMLSAINEAKSFDDLLDKVKDRVYYNWLIRTNYGSMPIIEGNYDDYFTADNYVKYVESFGDVELTNRLKSIVLENKDIYYVDNNFKLELKKTPIEQPVNFHLWSNMFRVALLVLD
jgi:hypothetical protein